MTTSNIDLNDPLVKQLVREYQEVYKSYFEEILSKAVVGSVDEEFVPDVKLDEKVTPSIGFDALEPDLSNYLSWIGESIKDISEELSTVDFYIDEAAIDSGIISNRDGSLTVNLNDGTFSYSEVEYPETEFRTDSGCEYSIFEDDEEAETFHIEIDPDWLWTKDDVWELIQKLLYTIGEVDEDGELVGKEPEKQLFIISTPGAISEETGNAIGRHAKEALEKANIDAVPLILSDGLTAWFEKPKV